MTASTPSVLIVGGGLAALRTAAELRERGFVGHLTVVAEEPHAPYDRPPLSKELFTRDAPAPLDAQGLGELDSLADRLLQPARVIAVGADDEGALATVVGIDVGERVTPPAGAPHPRPGDRVVGAATVRADVLVLATGAEPVTPRGLEPALTLRTWQDARNLRAALGRLEGTDDRDARAAGNADASDSPRLVVVGAGWIGAEVASAAARAGVPVTVLEAGPAPLARELGTDLGARTIPWFVGAGVDLRTDTAAESIEGHTVHLRDGSIVSGEAVLVAAGARPRTDLLGEAVTRDASGAVIVHPDGRPVGGPRSVRVVGDAATIRLDDGTLVPGGHWDGALHHPGLVAAALICDTVFGVRADELDHVPAPSTFSTMFGHEILTFGAPGAEPGRGPRRVVLREDAAGWTALTLDGDSRLTGAVLVDHPRDASPLRKALARGARPAVDAARLADLDTPLRTTLRG